MNSDAGDPRTIASDQDQEAVPWQFSLRSLLIVVTVVSVLLTVGVYFAGVLAAFMAVGLVQAAILLFADWLIRPGNRSVLAFVTAASWATIGSSFAIVAGFLAQQMIAGGEENVLSWLFVLFLGVCACVSYVMAKRRWQQLRSRGRAHV